MNHCWSRARLCTMQALWSYGVLSLIQLDCFSCKLRLYQTGNFHKNCLPMPLERNTYRLLIILILGGLHDDGLILIMLKVCLINFPACASCVFKHGYINLVMMSGFTFKESFHYICKYCQSCVYINLKMNNWLIYQHAFIDMWSTREVGEHERLGTLSSQDGNAKEDLD